MPTGIPIHAVTSISTSKERLVQQEDIERDDEPCNHACQSRRQSVVHQLPHHILSWFQLSFSAHQMAWCCGLPTEVVQSLFFLPGGMILDFLCCNRSSLHAVTSYVLNEERQNAGTYSSTCQRSAVLPNFCDRVVGSFNVDATLFLTLYSYPIRVESIMSMINCSPIVTWEMVYQILL